MRDRRCSGSGRTIARWLHALIRCLAVCLTGLLIALPMLVFSVPQAAADDSTDTSIELTKLTPSIVRPDSTIVIEGRVTNVSKHPLVRLQATIWRSLTPLTTQAQLLAADNSAPTDPLGERMYSADTPDAYQDLYTEQNPDLAPGQSQTFTVRAKASDFFGSTTPVTGVYLAGIQVREDGALTVGRARTLLPVAVGNVSTDGMLQNQASIGSTTLVELTTTPTMSRPGIFVNNDLADEVSAGGRLDALLTAAEQSGASYAIDPDLIAELEAMRSGYKIINGDGPATTNVPAGKDGSAAAAAWLARFRTMQTDHDGFQLLYADADLAAMVHAGDVGLIRRGQRAAATVDDTKNLPLLVAPADGAADQATLQAAGQLHARAVLLADTTVNGLGPVVQVPGSPLVLSYDTGSGEVDGPGPDPRNTKVQVRQASLAGSFLDSISGRPSTSLGRLRVVTDAQAAGGESAALAAPWLKPRGAYALLNNTPQMLAGQLNSVGDGRLGPNPEELAQITSLSQRLNTYQNLAADPTGIGALGDQAVARAASQAWRGHRGPMADFINDQQLLLTDTNGKQRSLADLTNGTLVRVESNPRVTLTGSSAAVPVTIVNDLSIPIRVQLLGESPNRARLQLASIPAAKLGVVEPGAKVQEQLQTRVAANGTVIVTLQLATPNGDLVGQQHQLSVDATQAGMIGWIIAIASGIVLLGTVMLRIRQVARERGDAPEEDQNAEQQDEQGVDDQEEEEEQEDTVIRPRRGVSTGLRTDGAPRG